MKSINTGSAPNDNTGDSIRSAMTKVNDNFTEADDRLFAVETGQSSAVVGYATQAQLYANLTPVDKSVAYVTNDTTAANNGTYRKSGATGTGSWIQSSFDRVAILESEIAQRPIIIKGMQRYREGELTSIDHEVPNILTAIQSIELFGADTSMPHKLRYLKRNATGDWRFIIARKSGAVWEDWLDTTALVVTENSGGVTTVSFTSGTKSVTMKIMYDRITDGTAISLEGSAWASTDPFFIIDPLYINMFSQDLPLTMSALETPEMSLINEYFSSVWSRYKADISTLDDAMGYGGKRKLRYQAVKRLELYGFDNTKPLMLSHIWNDSYNSTGHHYYRLIFKEWNGTSWETVFDSTAIEKATLGVIDGKVFTWDITVSGKRVVADIDYSNMAINDAETLNTTDPEFVVSQNCFNMDLAGLITTFNGTKQYYTSRRKPTFAFIWDDLNTTDALVYSVFKDFGYIPSFAICTSNLNSSNASEYQNYYLNGCTILAHSVTHPVFDPATLSYNEADAEMVDSKTAIEAYGIKVSGWVTPSSTLDVSFEPLMVKNFGYGFTKEGGAFNSTVDPLKLSRYGLEGGMAGHGIATVKARIDTAITNGELLVFYGHKLPSTYLNGDSTPYMTEADLRELLTYLKTKSDNNLCQVLSCDEAIYQYYKTPFA